MFDKVDLEFEEVEEPVNGWCASGHKAPPFFRREGPKSLELPTRFFLVKNKDIYAVYCEPCLIIANHIARQKKLGLDKK